MQSNTRIRREYKDICNEAKSTGVTAELVSGNWKHWKGRINGPEDTVYEGGTFFVDIHIPDNYPFVPPKMKFITKVWHPNVSSNTGAICLDILKDEWTPALNMRTTLLSLQALLCDPNPTDPQDAQVASQYLKDRAAFDRTARFWTQTYAKEQDSPELKLLLQMGFPRQKSIDALASANGNTERAILALLG
jgi:ubiquitin-conjugating enzyme (huntingtin interacting protein 2)